MASLGPERESFWLIIDGYISWGELIAARINSRLLEKYKGQTVRLTGKLIDVNGATATLQASDGGQVGLSSPILLSGLCCLLPPLRVIQS